MEHKYYKIIVETAPNLIWKANTEAKCDYFNTTWLEFTGRTIEQEYGDGWAEGVHPDDLDRCLKIYLESFAKREPFEMEYRLRRHDGVYRWLNDRGVPFYENQVFGGYIGSCLDVTDKIEGQKLKFEAQKDGLTGINNRQHFEKLFKEEFAKAKVTGEPISIVLLDLDDFKKINDTYGHLVGDTVLTALVKILEKNIRKVDLCGRYGGEEFVLALPGIPAKKAMAVAERLRKKLEKTAVKYKGGKISFSASFGLAQLSDEKVWNQLLDKADKAMYISKKNGKNCVTQYS